MDTPFQPTARTTAALLAGAGLATVALQTTINLDHAQSPLMAFAHMLRFFTIWTNFGGALLFAWVAGGRALSSRVLLSLAAAYAVVAIVYHALLAADHHPVGLDWWTNLMFHTLLPMAAIGWWFAFAPRAEWRDLPAVMIAPVVYTMFAFIVGAQTGFYPYFFLDQPHLGWPAFFGWLVALALFFVVTACLLNGVRAATSRGRRAQ